MRQNLAIFSQPLTLTADVSKYTFVDLSGANAAPGGYALGSVITNGDAGDTVTVDVIGTAQVIAGAAISVGAEIEVGPNGKAITKTTGKTVARAFEAASGDGSVLEVLLLPS